MIRLAIFVFLLIVLYKLLSGLVKGPGTSNWQGTADEKRTAELVQDPQCGAYVLPAQGVSTRVADKTYHFCSKECRDKFNLERSE
jgi:YHS domain-containing protein